MRYFFSRFVIFTLLSLFTALFLPHTVSAQTQIAPGNITATASSAYAGYPASAATDGNNATPWNAGQGAGSSPYIEFDLGADTSLYSIQMLVNQSPSGQTSHTVSGRTAAGGNVNFSTLTGNTTDGQTLSLSLTGTAAVRYVRITTTVSPAWVAWNEVRIYKVAAQTGTLAATPASCAIATGQTFCGSSPSLTGSVSSGWGRVWVTSAPAGAPELNGWVFDTTSSTTVSIGWIRAGTYVFQLRSGTSITGALLAQTTITGVAQPAASFVSQSVPTTMTAGQSYPVSLTFSNSGASTWSSGSGFKLGSQNPQDNNTWGFNRVSVPASVAPGQQVTFSFNVTAPATAGSYNFQWRMLQEGGVSWFGTASTNTLVTVSGTSGSGNLISNGGFESPYIADYAYNPSIPGWTNSGGVVVQRNGSVWGAPNAPEGAQTAVLQSSATLTTALNLSAGQYLLKFKAAPRTNYGGQQTVQIKVNGTTVHSVAPVGGSFTQHQITISATQGSNSIAFVGASTSGDNSAFLDDVQLIAAPLYISTPKHFSYFYVGENGTHNYSSAINDHVTLAWAFVDPTDVNSLNSLKTFINGLPGSVKVVLNGPIFFGNPTGTGVVHAADWATRWAALTGAGGLSAAQYERIAAIYLLDEPDAWPDASVSAQQIADARTTIQTAPPSGTTYIPKLATTYTRFVSINPNTPNYPQVAAKGIASFDWIGSNCYPTSWPDGTGIGCEGTTLEQHYANLKAKRTSTSQKILLIAETAIARQSAGDTIATTRQQNAISNLTRMRQLAMNEADVVGVVAFSYEGVPASSAPPNGWAGANLMPNVATAARLLGRCVIGAGVCDY